MSHPQKNIKNDSFVVWAYCGFFPSITLFMPVVVVIVVVVLIIHCFSFCELMNECAKHAYHSHFVYFFFFFIVLANNCCRPIAWIVYEKNALAFYVSFLNSLIHKRKWFIKKKMCREFWCDSGLWKIHYNARRFSHLSQ